MIPDVNVHFSFADSCNCSCCCKPTRVAEFYLNRSMEFEPWDKNKANNTTLDHLRDRFPKIVEIKFKDIASLQDIEREAGMCLHNISGPVTMPQLVKIVQAVERISKSKQKEKDKL